MTKLIYETRGTKNAKGEYFDCHWVDDDYEVKPPFTDKPIPEEIMAGKARFDWNRAGWVDMSDKENWTIVQKLSETIKKMQKSQTALLLDGNSKAKTIKQLQTSITNLTLTMNKDKKEAAEKEGK